MHECAMNGRDACDDKLTNDGAMATMATDARGDVNRIRKRSTAADARAKALRARARADRERFWRATPGEGCR